MRSTRRLLPVLLALLVPAAARAATPCDSPEAVARRLYESSYSFFSEGAPAGLLAPAFEKAVRAEVSCLAKEGLCNLDYDPWLGAQDGEIAGKPGFVVVSSMGDFAAVVQMSYRFTVEAGKSTPHAVEIVLRRETGQCWKVADLITPICDSLLHLLSTP